MGRLTLDMLLSFAQFEREVTSERIRDKIAAFKRKDMWMGEHVPLGYCADGRTLKIDEAEAPRIGTLYDLYRKLGSVREVKDRAEALGFRFRRRARSCGRVSGGNSVRPRAFASHSQQPSLCRANPAQGAGLYRAASRYYHPKDVGKG